MLRRLFEKLTGGGAAREPADLVQYREARKQLRKKGRELVREMDDAFGSMLTDMTRTAKKKRRAARK